MKSNKSVTWILILYALSGTTCYPTGRSEIEPELKDEKRFPNGTVIGKYTYMDKEGNPVQVKYYADDESYGVELKSVKYVGSSKSDSAPTTEVYSENDDPIHALAPLLVESKIEPSEDIFKTIEPLLKKKTNELFQYLPKDSINRYKVKKSSRNFETFYQNDLKGNEHCGEEKVRVYLDKDRKIRSAVDDFAADKYCERL